jgi:hypothetical protein
MKMGGACLRLPSRAFKPNRAGMALSLAARIAVVAGPRRSVAGAADPV